MKETANRAEGAAPRRVPSDDTGVPIPAGFVKPAWLRSKDPEKYAAAMMQCRDPQGLCGDFDHGSCRQRNWCFAAVRARYDRLTRVRDELDRRIQKMMQSLDGDL